MAAELIDVRAVLTAQAPLTPNEIQSLQRAISGSQAAEVRQEVQSLQSSGDVTGNSQVRIGIGCYLLANHSAANSYLSRVSGEPVGCFYHALVLTAMGKFREASERFDEASAAGYDRVECALRKSGCMRSMGQLDDAEKLLRSVAAAAASRAEYSFQMGCIWADRGDALTAIEYFERAVDMDPHHTRALFWLAAENALRGNDDEAIRLYEQALSKPPIYLGALLNLGLLYEDKENYAAAAYCFRRVVEADPGHERARLYLKDIEATDDMYYDEDSARNEARLKQLLSRPVTDFELSVRSRNCLAGMNIESLGDLTEISEQELLSGKNFGETSLHEIREMLTAHGLRIGQNLHKIQTREPVFEPNLSPEEQALMSQPVADMEVSVRARKCMARLGIITIGQLVQRTPDELLSSRNFGVTSLNEIRARLSELGTSLRND